MEGRHAAGIAVVLTNCKDPAQEAEMNRWYNSTHLPDVTGPGIYGVASRYVNPAAKATKEDPKYLALYETERADAAAAWAENVKHRDQWHPWKEGQLTHPALGIGGMAVYQRIGSLPRPPQGRKTRGVLLAMTECTEPAREDEFNKWYDEHHAADVVKTGLFWSAARYVNTDLKSNLAKYLAVYETDGDATENVKKIRDHPVMKASPRLDIMKVRYVGAFNHLYTYAAKAPAAARAGRA